MHENKFEKLEFGKWSLKLPALADGSCPIKNGSIIKVIQLKFCYLGHSHIAKLNLPFERIRFIFIQFPSCERSFFKIHYHFKYMF